MKILSVSDKVEKSFLKENILSKNLQGIQVILACGDLPPYYLEYLVNRFNAPLYYVPGNHDDAYLQSSSAHQLSVKGCVNIDQRVVAFKNLLIGGLAGAFQYKKGTYLYTEAEMHQKIVRMRSPLFLNKFKYKRAIDILITHAPPLGIHDENDVAHRGFREFLLFMKKYRPAYLIHGHTTIQGGEEGAINRYHFTRVINTNPYRILEIHDAAVR